MNSFTKVLEVANVAPRPEHLTADKIEKRMEFIKPGDLIHFDSMKECYESKHVDRYASTIHATGEVVENCGGYLMVKLRNGLLESVNYFGIFAVNGLRFCGYSPKAIG